LKEAIVSNNKGNPEIAKHGTMTRFTVGGRNCPLRAQRKAAPPWSIKRALRRLLRAEFSADKPLTHQTLRRVFCPRGRHITGVQALAIHLFLAAMTDAGAMEKLVWMAEGPPGDAEQEEG
jgi:hypothetical protein